jgi:hypothetical protein
MKMITDYEPLLMVGKMTVIISSVSSRVIGGVFFLPLIDPLYLGSSYKIYTTAAS